MPTSHCSHVCSLMYVIASPVEGTRPLSELGSSLPTSTPASVHLPHCCWNYLEELQTCSCYCSPFSSLLGKAPTSWHRRQDLASVQPHVQLVDMESHALQLNQTAGVSWKDPLLFLCPRRCQELPSASCVCDGCLFHPSRFSPSGTSS